MIENSGIHFHFGPALGHQWRGWVAARIRDYESAGRLERLQAQLAPDGPGHVITGDMKCDGQADIRGAQRTTRHWATATGAAFMAPKIVSTTSDPNIAGLNVNWAKTAALRTAGKPNGKCLSQACEREAQYCGRKPQ